MPIATTNALSLVSVPGQTATLPLLLLTSFATVATAYSESVNCYADAATATAMLLLPLRYRVLLQFLQ